MNYASCQVLLIKDGKIEGQKMTVDKKKKSTTTEKRTATSSASTETTHVNANCKNERTQSISSAVCEVLDCNHLIVICCLVE